MSSFRHLGLTLCIAGTLASGVVLAQSSSQDTSDQQRKRLPSEPVPRSTDSDEERSPENQQKRRQAATREAGDSSSRDQIIDLSPPRNDAKDHPDSDVSDPDSDVSEFHQWDPHKAQKSVEVGDFYLKRKNYAAAIDRYREALQYKPNDAIATFRLAQALEQDQKFDDARKEYANYLKILPHGPSAADARKALERLHNTAVNQSSGKANPQKP